ncbi:beta-hexosaminidase [Fomitiporia mediterranea MF3/22]|uniref:Beta-hexosaminidase n=1 Tax=Fomitiporia mediterranea (strain MF3/22) TaxID=694068 RepID=R7SJN3_FOMME|nr:beta-hexosaminidase [Fomitiporia mediterranea MF3/22]EJC97794.1 beta-hexosaminidase [Fomitiporia mediterranea MF3/22]
MLLYSISCLFVLLLRAHDVHAIWPRPRSVTSGTQALRLSTNFSIVPNFQTTADIDSAISRTQSLIQNDKLGRLVVGRGSSDASAVQSAQDLRSLELSLTNNSTGPVSNITTEAQKPLSERDESYTLIIPSDGTTASLSANSSLGLLRGLTTFSQIWYDLNGEAYTLNTPISIEDSPAFPYRGFMLDTARNFFPTSAIKRTLDAMSWVKINTFHWHITDSQSFPLQVPGFMELSAAGAYSNASTYSLSDIQDIVSYAGERGVDVLIEIDSPGHSAAIGESHPEHIACFHASPWSSFAAGQLRIASPSTTNFSASLFSAVASMMPSSLLSTGGDEVNEPCYAEDTQTQAALNATGMTIEQALSNFTQATHGALRDAGKTPVVWEEMVLEHNVTLGNDTVVMVWISSQNAAAVAAKGFRLVHGPSDYFYLDCGAGEWLGNDVTGNSWCDPFKTWQKAYSFDPYANLTSEQKSLVLGGQQLLWTEQSAPQNLDSIVWPRAAASAEVFWTGGTLTDGGLNVTEALPRLHEMRFRMVQRGVNAIPLQPEWCAIRPGECDG